MEEVIKSIRRACVLVQHLESELPNLGNLQGSMLCLSIDEITETLSAAKERVLLMCGQDQASASSMMQLHETQMDATLMHEWLSSSHALTMDHMVQMQQHHASRSTLKSTIGDEIGGKDVEDSERSKGSEGEVKAIEASSSRPRRRNREADLEKRKRIVPAPLFGNTEMPPDDGFTWRKYGQKDILGSKFPRSYYRCTHQKLYECHAKKQVQRYDHNPYFFEVTYRGNHTCHISLIAPSSVQPQQLLGDITHNSDTISSKLSLSMKLSHQTGGGSSGSGDYPVLDMADVMFNSGSSSGNSMESLFPPPEDK